MQAVFPRPIEACTQNRLIHLVNAAMPHFRGPWRPAAADGAGLLHDADAEFVRLLGEERPGWSGPHLPAPLKQVLVDGTARRYVGRCMACKLAPMGDLTLVQIRPASPIDPLTPCEREIAVHTAQGLTHKEIARPLELSPTTVRTHLAASCRRIGVKNKAQMAALVHSLE